MTMVRGASDARSPVRRGPHDPVTFAAVPILMAFVGLAACWIPALRASRIDLVIAMRAT
ncbi:MAG TPA: hypothetical protein VF178_14520 [Gemmatimonadaceae bacterium]